MSNYKVLDKKKNKKTDQQDSSAHRAPTASQAQGPGDDPWGPYDEERTHRLSPDLHICDTSHVSAHGHAHMHVYRVNRNAITVFFKDKHRLYLPKNVHVNTMI